MASIVVLDYGSQYTRLIARRLRELNVYSAVLSADTSLETLRAREARGVILSGGPSSVYDEGAPGLPEGLLEAGLPVLAICYGMQLVAKEAGGEVKASSVREYGKAALAAYSGTLFDGVEGDFVAWMSHGDAVSEPPPASTSWRARATRPSLRWKTPHGGFTASSFIPRCNIRLRETRC